MPFSVLKCLTSKISIFDRHKSNNSHSWVLFTFRLWYLEMSLQTNWILSYKDHSLLTFKIFRKLARNHPSLFMQMGMDEIEIIMCINFVRGLISGGLKAEGYDDLFRILLDDSRPWKQDDEMYMRPVLENDGHLLHDWSETTEEVNGYVPFSSSG